MLDGSAPSSYLSAPMNRLLITFLALLTGLVAQASPAAAAARVGGQTEVGVLAVPARQTGQRTTAAAAAMRAATSRPTQLNAAQSDNGIVQVAPRPVLTRIDRARE
jgi:hypothetical protein